MQNNNRFAAVVILYHPTSEVLLNIMSYYDKIDKIFVFDNSPNEAPCKEQLTQLPNLEYYHDSKNEGIAKRLNTAAELAIEHNFNWLLTMDQDTRFSPDAIATFSNCFQQYPGKDQVALFCTDYSTDEDSVDSTCRPGQVENLVTSGSLLNLTLFKEIGKFDENLFIDSVDHDYNIRAKVKGYLLIKFSNIRIHHNIGMEVYRASIKTLFLVKKRKIIHSPLRCYYMYRNLLYLEKKLGGCGVSLMQELRNIVTGELERCLFYGRNTIAIIRYLIRAKRDFKKNRFGKIVES